ncbi:hypothetical protein [Jeotgalibacillus soli]|uniref:Uncharacterized protein n=1 Tax=Jeotgalibacillus soli TaxID=889306 RepID=A0A0C2W1V7_9BACL|nr:hypothetical protein [Jeotgalibacillus soli]KIL50606.1 hypothetical protein KP78_06070 [Jeotgalibacillus soli]
MSFGDFMLLVKAEQEKKKKIKKQPTKSMNKKKPQNVNQGK